MHPRTLYLLITGLLAAILAGCASAPSVSMAERDRQTIKRVQIDPAVKLPPWPVYLHGNAVASTVAVTGGIIGAIASESAGRAEKTNVAEFALANGFAVGDIVKAEFARAAEGAGAMRFSETEANPDGYLSFTVNGFGFGQVQGLSSTLYPLMNITATLRRPDGTVAWQGTEFVSPFNSENKPGYEYADYISDPQKTRDALVRVAAIVSRLLVADLHRSR